FLTLVTFCGNTGEPMDLSRVDGSIARQAETRLDQVKRLATFLCLKHPKKVKLDLHNAYRDVHFWKLSDGADFEKEARAAEMRARPFYEVGTLEIDSEVPAARRYLERYTWANPDHIWEEFEAPFLDMGTCLKGKGKRFKMEIYNRGLVLARIQLETASLGPLSVPWADCMLGPGRNVTVMMDAMATECGEWRGQIQIKAAWVGIFGVNEEEARVPTYLCVKEDLSAACLLPAHACRPFRPDSANRIRIDPTSLHARQLRAPSPHKRPNSSSSASRASSAKPERPGSSRTENTTVPGSRPLSALGPPSSRCTGSAVPTSRSARSGVRGVKALPQDDPDARKLRPRSAPSGPGLPKVPKA
ncbi:unnamed protein product, partial [Effrenium voratum]